MPSRWPPLGLQLLVLASLSSAGAAIRCPEACRCGQSRTRTAADCSSSSLSSAPAGLDAATTILDLSYNRLAALRNGSLSRVSSSLQKLVLLENVIAEVESGAFQGFSQLWWLSLENNALHNLHPYTFSGAPKLWKLILSGNPLHLPLDGGPFLVAPHLRILELSRCGISTVPPATFRNLTGLWTLRLKENRLRAVDGLTDLPELEVLDLHGNEIVSIRPDAFIAVPKLKQLNVSSNPLLVPSSGTFLNAAHLSFLDLSRTNVTRLGPDVFSGTPALTVLRISKTPLSWIDSRAFSNLSQLERAALDNNAISTLDASTFSSNGQLLELDLSGNGLEVGAQRVLLRAAALTRLEVGGARMPALGADTFRGLPALSVLGAPACGLASLADDAFAALPDLYELHLQDNLLTALPHAAFSRCHRLAEVNLRGNRLLQLSSFPAAPALERLDLGHCGLEGELPSFGAAPRLRRLLIDGNRLTSLDAEGLTATLPHLRRLGVQNNPWSCDCRLRPLWRWCHAAAAVRSPAVQVLGRPIDIGEDATRCPEDVMCGQAQHEHWDLLETLHCPGDPESGEAVAEHDPNLDVEMISMSGRQRSARRA
ncbi:insulin-like growth factor-binding protein complex acid labile subunit [Schistocerca gregaria]|uniref:insulin-like growth factor-binding protein complex acid labile subunit n=1 Tax=Schistocerca gregaria TaxID=7010 RepID=UPI00211E73D2|nr:insulin-like growth factor-binding protein complex acid labile subunit [Schistocerca gregaria]